MIEHFSPEKKAILFGHSWGGMYNALLINNYPELVSAVIFSEPGPLSRELGNLVVHSSNAYGFTSEMVSDAFYSQEFLSPSDHNSLDYFMQVITLEPQPHRSVDGTRYNKYWRLGGWVMNWLDVKNLSWKEFDFTTNLKDYNKKVLFLGTDGSERIVRSHGKGSLSAVMRKREGVEPRKYPYCTGSKISYSGNQYQIIRYGKNRSDVPGS